MSTHVRSSMYAYMYKVWHMGPKSPEQAQIFVIDIQIILIIFIFLFRILCAKYENIFILFIWC